MTSNPQILHAGDVIKARLRKFDGISANSWVTFMTGRASFKNFDLDILSVERAPEPLKAGDRVLWAGEEREVFGIHGETAWVSSPWSDFGTLVTVKHLERIP